MKIVGLAVAGLSMMVWMAGCTPGSGQPYALRGSPAENSGINSANFIIGGKECRFVVMVGYYYDSKVYTYPCKVTDDEANALGDLHTHVTIEISTQKGPQTVKINGGTEGMTVDPAHTPDMGFMFPPNWAVAPLAKSLTLRNSDNGPVHVAVSVQGAECAMKINDAAVECGLSYWSDGGFSIWVPGLLVSAQYANTVVGLSFGKTPTGRWSIARAPQGFPVDYTEVTPGG